MINLIDPNPYFSLEEKRTLSQKNDLKGWLEVVYTWTWIAAAFVLVALYPNVFTVILALVILGAKQLACAILMHDCGHYSMFKKKRVNIFVGKWLSSYMIMNDVGRYRPYHIQHHLHTGTEEDPDLSLTWGYPATGASMLRKFARDLFGATGIKAQLANLAMKLNFLAYNLSRKVERLDQSQRSWGEFIKTAVNNLHGPILANACLLGILWITGNPYLYLLWIGALFTTFNFFLRIRSIAEHSMVEDQEDPIRNTRTTKANWLERQLFAPHHVNYHLEHHMLMGVPSYNLPKMHRMLVDRGFYQQGLLEKGYWSIIKKAMQKAEATTGPSQQP